MNNDQDMQSEDLLMSIDFTEDFRELEDEQAIISQPQGRLCAGLILITHGFDMGFIGEPEWTNAMQSAIIKRIRANARRGRIRVSRADNEKKMKLSIEWLNQNASGQFAGSGSDCEIVIRIDWTEIANYLATGISTRMIADSLASFLCSPASGISQLHKLPMHFIGHSRGASLLCELARILGKYNIAVEHFTTLDPHPLTQNDLQSPSKAPVIDAPVIKYDNIRFMDNYWQQIAYPKGQPVAGAYNRCFSRLPGAYHQTIHAGFGNHMNIVMAYYATIDLNSPPVTTEALLKESHRQIWFTPEEEKGAKTGFYFSRVISPDSRPEQSNIMTNDQPAENLSDDSDEASEV